MKPARWSPFPPGSDEDWDRIGEGLPGDNPFQSAAWGRYKQNYGWEPQRWIAADEERGVVGALQLLKKNLPFGRSLIWAPGGPQVGFQGTVPEDLEDLFSEGLGEICRANRAAYARVYSFQPPSSSAAGAFSGFGPPPSCKLGSGTTVELDLALSSEQLLAGMDRKHRYLVRRFGEGSLEWRSGREEGLVADLCRLHQEMSSRKKVWAADPEDLRSLVSAFGEKILVLTGAIGGEAVSGCMVLLKGRSAFYWRAATSPKGREVSAAYPMIFELFKLLKTRGVERFDFGGILPGDPSAEGVDHFKKGFGGKIVEYLGEREWAASPNWVRWGVNAWAKHRKK